MIHFVTVSYIYIIFLTKIKVLIIKSVKYCDTTSFFIKFRVEVGDWTFYHYPHSQKIMAELTNKSILVIENDEKVLEALSARFRAKDMLVITATDGYDGYTRACKESPDMIIAETLLPSMDGYRLARLLKFDERYKHIPILLITQKPLQTVQIMFNSSGADNIIAKPFRFGDLKDKIQELIS
tara:strand:- start:129 stop:674 length:546 start_codon:yes stop_codon:yes gene_type:complete